MELSMWILTGVFLVAMILGCPIGFSMILAFLGYIYTVGDIPLSLLPLKLTGALDSFSFMAIPYFLLAALIMNSVGVTERLFDFVRAILGRVRGGLAHANVVAGIIFAGISGSAAADAAGLGTIIIKTMEDGGYKRDFSAAVTAAASTIGPIIPPSIAMVIYGVLASQDIRALFAGGIVPGVLMGVSLMVYIAIIAKKMQLPVENSRFSFKEVAIKFRRAILPLFAPVIIVGSILTGIATPTEGGSLAVFYSLLLGAIYRTLRLKEIIKALQQTAGTTALVLFMIAASGAFGWAVTIEKIPEKVLTFLQSFTQNPTLTMFLICFGLLILGCIMSADAGLIITIPILVTVAQGFGIDLVYMGVLCIVTLTLGVITPPVGISLYILTDIAKLPFEQIVKATVPMVIPLVILVALLIFFPEVVMFIPHLIGK